jgi:alpha-glucosidase
VDYIYTALYRQSTVGTPLMQPLFFHYPDVADTFGIQSQWMYGPNMMVAPVMDEAA